MSNESDGERTYVIFIDSMGDDDLAHMPFVSSLQTGTLDCFVPFVTPTVLGSIYTGKNPAEHGLPSVSRYGADPRTRPRGYTLPEIAAVDDTYGSVMCLGLPFIAPPAVKSASDGDVAGIKATDEYYHTSGAMDQQSTYPANRQAGMHVPAPGGSLDDPRENEEMAFNLRSDYTDAYFCTARNLSEAWDIDLSFLSYRVCDAYCHYHHDKPVGGDKNRREMLLERVDEHIKDIHRFHGDVFVFGDHGSTDLTSVFRMNRWLMDNGYLELEIDTDWRDKSFRYGALSKDDDYEKEVGTQLSVDAPGVIVDEEASVAVGADPFSTGITLLDGATDAAVDDLIDDLCAEDDILDVFWTKDKWQGDLLDECPDLYAHRAPGVFVSGNVHPQMGGVEVTRTGVHHMTGGWASSRPVSRSSVDPMEMFGLIIHDYLGIDDVHIDGTTDRMDSTTDRRSVMDNLEDLGYI